MIAGMIVQGFTTQKVIVRALGPSLSLFGRLLDPTLELRDGNGALIGSNDNWRDSQEADIILTIPPANNKESAEPHCRQAARLTQPLSAVPMERQAWRLWKFTPSTDLVILPGGKCVGSPGSCR